MTKTFEDLNERHGQWLGKIGQESVIFKDGYLVCPWLSSGVNDASLRFMTELFTSHAMSIYGPDDGIYFTPEQLGAIQQLLPAL